MQWDSGVYGMASLVLELAKGEDLEIKIIPGVTAACSGAAVLGAPLSHDFAVISLSDLLTPWKLIEKRIQYAAMGDFVICIYNPSSKKRADYLRRASEIVLQYQSPDTVCGYVRNIGRDGEEKRILSLKQLQEAHLDMFTTVYIGNSQTTVMDGRMVTREDICYEKSERDDCRFCKGQRKADSYVNTWSNSKEK